MPLVEVTNRHSQSVVRAGQTFPAGRSVETTVPPGAMAELRACRYLVVEATDESDE
jgi:hypothetical protein